MHTPAVPAVRGWLDETTMLRLLGAMTVISLVAVCVPTVSVIVTAAGAAGAVHANVVPEAARRRKEVDYIEISRADWMEWKPVGDLINAARQKSGK